MSVVVRYFAGARAAAGVDEDTVDAVTVRGALDAAIAARPGDLARVVGLSSFLLDGVSVEPDAPVQGGQRIDVLPPFAGG